MGMLFNMHTCGKVDRIIDGIVAMGPDVIDSMMVCNDLDHWMEAYDKKVIFMGGLDNQGVIDRVDATSMERITKIFVSSYTGQENQSGTKEIERSKQAAV